jgi:hypothetical protein
MLTLPSSVRIFVYTQPADMRCGFNKLSMFANYIMGQDPFSGHLFVYFNKRGDKCKILFWDRTGFCIWYNGPPFIARDFKAFIHLCGMTHVRTSPYFQVCSRLRNVLIFL